MGVSREASFEASVGYSRAVRVRRLSAPGVLASGAGFFAQFFSQASPWPIEAPKRCPDD
jgi:hypothetical protein